MEEFRDFPIEYQKTADINHDAENIINAAQQYAYRAVNVAMVARNWMLGRRIAEEELQGTDRADYGAEVIKSLSRYLSNIFGKGFDRSNLYHYLDFYRTFPKIVDTLRRQSENILSWSHYRCLLRVDNDEARNWYEHEALEQAWSFRTLQRNISTQYYERLLLSQKKDSVIVEMKEKTVDVQTDRLEFIKNPIVAEFLGLSNNPDLTESTLETAIINNLQKFLMELGKGYAFVARQQHIKTEKKDYFIDLVFYNYILKCFVLVDLKTDEITHQDVGQMDMYVRMYDELKRGKDDNPTLGIILCSDTDEDIARYSVLHGNEQLFATKYKLYLPDEQELKREIEQQKAIYFLQQQEKEENNL